MNHRRQPAPLGGKRSVLHSQPSAGEQGGRGHPIITMLSVAWAYVASLHRTLLVLLCPLFLAGATTGAWAQTGSDRGAC